MPYPLISVQQLIERVGPRVLQRSLDLEELGEVNEDLAIRLCKDASSKVLGSLHATYPTAIETLRAMAADDENFPDEVTRITLDAAQAFHAMQFPTITSVDGHRLMRRVNEDLSNIRLTISTLGVTGAPEPASNQGAEAFGLNPDKDYAPEPHTFAGGFGEFG